MDETAKHGNMGAVVVGDNDFTIYVWLYCLRTITFSIYNSIPVGTIIFEDLVVKESSINGMSSMP